jgi:hypothetical protein
MSSRRVQTAPYAPPTASKNRTVAKPNAFKKELKIHFK